jgi:hypothetical protein
MSAAPRNMAKAVILNNRLLAKDGDFVEFWRAGGRSQMLELEWGVLRIRSGARDQLTPQIIIYEIGNPIITLLGR